MNKSQLIFQKWLYKKVRETIKVMWLPIKIFVIPLLSAITLLLFLASIDSEILVNIVILAFGFISLIILAFLLLYVLYKTEVENDKS